MAHFSRRFIILIAHLKSLKSPNEGDGGDHPASGALTRHQLAVTSDTKILMNSTYWLLLRHVPVNNQCIAMVVFLGIAEQRKEGSGTDKA